MAVQGGDDPSFGADQGLLSHHSSTHQRAPHAKEEISTKKASLAVRSAMRQAPERREVEGRVLGDPRRAVDAKQAAQERSALIVFRAGRRLRKGCFVSDGNWEIRSTTESLLLAVVRSLVRRGLQRSGAEATEH